MVHAVVVLQCIAAMARGVYIVLPSQHIYVRLLRRLRLHSIAGAVRCPTASLQALDKD